MPNRTLKIFPKSLLAVSILALTGCASAPQMNDVDLSPIGKGILVAGRATAEVGVHAWDVGMYYLGFSDGGRDGVRGGARDRAQGDLTGRSDTRFPMDEIDEAMLKDDAKLPEDTLTPIAVATATPNGDFLFKTPSIDDLANFNETEETDPFLFEPKLEEGLTDVDDLAAALPQQSASDEAVAQTSNDAVADEQDFIHIVSNNENLWDIAKTTTGDAINWHVLADVNDLNQKANVYVGQALTIPAELLKAGYVDGIYDNGGVDIASNADLIAADEIDSSDQGIVVVAESDKSSSRLAIPTASETQSTAVKLNSGETLWNFAKRTTGDATNWKAIAKHNDFTEKQAVVVREGQSILVPEVLMKSETTLASAQPAAKKPLSKEAEAEVLAAIEKVNQSAITASSELLSEASSLSNAQLIADETQPITIVEANFQTDPSQQPIKIATDAVDVVKMENTSADLNRIMISGTYYPKAVYNAADFSSSLLMRVSPGTSLKVSKAVGNWFEVETNKGTGYVHQRDIK